MADYLRFVFHKDIRTVSDHTLTLSAETWETLEIEELQSNNFIRDHCSANS